MVTRTTKKTVTFDHPFRIGDFEEKLPAGSYAVETDEELQDGVSFAVYRRVLTVMHLPSRSGNSRLDRTLTIDPDDLKAALQRDQAPRRAVT